MCWSFAEVQALWDWWRQEGKRNISLLSYFLLSTLFLLVLSCFDTWIHFESSRNAYGVQFRWLCRMKYLLVPWTFLSTRVRCFNFHDILLLQTNHLSREIVYSCTDFAKLNSFLQQNFRLICTLLICQKKRQPNFLYIRTHYWWTLMIGVDKNQISLASGKFSANCNQPFTNKRYRVSGGTLVSLIFILKFLE